MTKRPLWMIVGLLLAAAAALWGATELSWVRDTAPVPDDARDGVLNPGAGAFVGLSASGSR